MGEGRIEEFVRLPASHEEVVHRVLGLVRATLRERALEDLRRTVARHPEQLRGIVTAIAHDLFSPLTAVIEYIELLRDGTIGAPSAEQQKLLGAAHQAARGLVERIEEIADASRGEVGLAIDVHLARTALGPLVEDLKEWAASRLAEKQQELEIEIDSATPDVCGDPDRLKQVLRHLVKNAHHFSPPDAKIVVQIAPDPDVVGFVLMSVSDMGPGIAPEEFAGCLDPFGIKADEAERSFRLGVGLALVQTIAKALGGEIDVADGPRGGSVIGVRIPVWESRAARISEVQVELASLDELPESAWLCRACGDQELTALEDRPAWRTLSPGEILTISEDPPAAGTALGRVSEFRQAESLLNALQPHLRLREVARDCCREVA
jgi:signal transduction histidine kinase